MDSRYKLVSSNEIINSNFDHLLQLKDTLSFPALQVPFHRVGIGPISLSLKLSDSGQTPYKFDSTHICIKNCSLFYIHTYSQKKHIIMK